MFQEALQAPRYSWKPAPSLNLSTNILEVAKPATTKIHGDQHKRLEDPRRRRRLRQYIAEKTVAAHNDVDVGIRRESDPRSRTFSPRQRLGSSEQRIRVNSCQGPNPAQSSRQVTTPSNGDFACAANRRCTASADLAEAIEPRSSPGTQALRLNPRHIPHASESRGARPGEGQLENESQSWSAALRDEGLVLEQRMLIVTGWNRTERRRAAPGRGRSPRLTTCWCSSGFSAICLTCDRPRSDSNRQARLICPSTLVSALLLSARCVDSVRCGAFRPACLSSYSPKSAPFVKRNYRPLAPMRGRNQRLDCSS